MTLSMVIFGTVAVFVRGLSLSPGEIALCRSAIAAVPIGLFLLFTKQRIGFDAWKREGLLLLLSGASLGINWLLLFESYRYTTVSTATLCYYFAPVIVTVVSPILFHERLTKGQILCFLMSFLAAVASQAAFRKIDVDYEQEPGTRRHVERPVGRRSGKPLKQ